MATAAELAAQIEPDWGCPGCEDQVLSSLARGIQTSYNQVVALKGYTKQFANLGNIVLQQAVLDVQTLVAAIPVPVPITFAAIPGYLTCPLLPLALDVVDLTELQALDPRSQLDRIRQLTVGWVTELRANYDRALRQLGTWQTVRLFTTYIGAVKRFGMTADRLAHDILIAGTVQAVCPDAYEGSIFEEFITATTDFSITGIVPVGLTGHANDLAVSLGEAEVKLTGWSIVSSGGAIP